jgi:hypothetical protein
MSSRVGDSFHHYGGSMPGRYGLAEFSQLAGSICIFENISAPNTLIIN